MNTIVSHLLAGGFGFIAAVVGFLWLNRNKAEQLDAVEGKVRDYKKKP